MRLAFPKSHSHRLTGRKKIELYKAVYKRDGGRCVRCGQWIEPGTIPHHIIHKSHGGEDTMDNLEMLCMWNNCHYNVHHGKGQANNETR